MRYTWLCATSSRVGRNGVLCDHWDLIVRAMKWLHVDHFQLQILEYSILRGKLVKRGRNQGSFGRIFCKETIHANFLKLSGDIIMCFNIHERTT